MTFLKKIFNNLIERHSIYLLFSLVLLVFIGPALQGFGIREVFYDVVLVVIAISGFVLVPVRKRSIIFKVTFVLVLAFSLIEILNISIRLEAFGRFMWSLFLLNVLYHIFRMTLHKDYSSTDAIINSISGYLVLGIIGATVFGAFQSFGLDPFREILDFYDIIYYSFVTMTTLGYGDISPYSIQGKSMAIVLTICGQLYIAIVIAINLAKYMSLINSDPTDKKLEDLNKKMDQLIEKIEDQKK